MTLGLLMPAAGASSRMRGEDKLLCHIDGVPLLVRQLQACLSLDLPVLVTLPPDNATRRSVLPFLAPETLTIQPLPDAATGLSASLRAGARWATDRQLTGLMIVLPDMPDLTASDLAKVARMHSAHPSQVIRATDTNGKHGHPTVIPAQLFPSLFAITGDQGARNILNKSDIFPCPLPESRALTDLDTPEDWAAWRAARD